jgi:predicted CXXCH cytochrome family protein
MMEKATRELACFRGILSLVLVLAIAPGSQGAQESPAPKKAAGEEAPEKEGTKDPGKYSGDCARSGCHEALKKQPFVHGPVSLGQCGPCHKPVEGEEHKFESPREEKELCIFCHEMEEKKEVVHKPYRPDACTGCHDPHGGKVKGFLLADSLHQLCETCHQAKEMQASKHAPVAAGECVKCHEPHQSDFKKLLVAGESEMCTGCHAEVGKTLKTNGHLHGPVKNGCLECHFGHTGPNPLLLRKPTEDLCASCHEDVPKAALAAPVVHGPMKGKEGCLACHVPHASKSEAMIKKSTPLELCLSCHTKEIAISGHRVAAVGKEIAEAKFKHGPIEKGQCVACHDPHSSQNGNLLVEKFPAGIYAAFKEEEYALCFTCHQKELVTETGKPSTGFRDGERNLHALHVNSGTKGRSCRVCHQVHASNLPKHIRKDVPFGKGAWALPIGFQKNPDGGTCTPGCHIPKTYHRPEPEAAPGKAKEEAKPSTDAPAAGPVESAPATAAAGAPKARAPAPPAASKPGAARASPAR